MTLPTVLRYTFLALFLNIPLTNAIPSLSSRFMHYGARSTLQPRRDHSINNNSNNNNKPVKEEKQQQDQESSLDRLAAKRLPHHYFTHFYLFSLACLLFWAHQILTGGAAVRYLVRSAVRSASYEPSVTMPPSRIALGWTLLFAQSARRLYESVVFASKPSSSSMWVGHYVVGMGYYLLVNPSVYLAEALPALSAAYGQHNLHQEHGYGQTQGQQEVSQDEKAWRTTTTGLAFPLDPSILHQPVASLTTALAHIRTRTAILLPLFILASALQHDAHMHLASLKDKITKKGKGRSVDTSSSSRTDTAYSLPTHPLFARLIAPHYTFEVAIYAILAFLLAPDRIVRDSSSAAATAVEGSSVVNPDDTGTGTGTGTTVTTVPVNWTIAAATVFVAANLGVTAAGTREWYAAKFGKEAVQGKWNLVPFVW